MSDDTISRFSLTMNKFMEALTDMINDLFDEELIPFNGGAVQVYGAIMKATKTEDLIWSVASTHEHWSKVLSKDNSFIFDIFPQYLRESGKPIDPAILSSPFRCYLQMKESDRWKLTEEDEWPINVSDLDVIWDYIRVMVGLSCTYAYEERKAVTDGRLRRGDIEPLYYQIDVDYWINAFNINIR